MSRAALLRADEELAFLTSTARDFKDLTGSVFGRLRVLGFVERVGNHKLWACQCECGNRVKANGSNLVCGNTSSCGCLHTEVVVRDKTKHGFSRKGNRTAEYTAYNTMLARCKRPQSRNVHYIRGIRVCDRWQYGQDGKSGFECFIADMGIRPSKDHSIDRINNDGNYEPENCRWATRSQQAANTTRNVYVEFNGTRMIMADAIRASGLTNALVYLRMKRGMTRQEALTRPKRQRKPL